MSSTLFCLLDRVMLSGESLQLNVSRGANDILVVLMQPVLRPTTETLSDDVEAIRAALAAPLYLAMPAAQLDARFEDLAGTYAAARTETHTGFDSLMQALREAVPAFCDLDEEGRARVHLDRVDLLITCVDRADVRVGIAKTAAASRARGLWADFGNAARTGQFVLGHLHEAPKGVTRLPHVVDLYPELAQVNDAEEPSCSFEEAITRQDLFINPLLAYTGISMLWNLFRHGALHRHAAFIDVERTSVQSLAIDSEAWKFFGYEPQRAGDADSRI